MLNAVSIFKQYKNVNNGIENVNLSISPGTSAALIGKNGSGKTTLINILINNIKKDNGTIEFFENKYDNHQEYVGVVFDDFRLPNKIKLDELNTFFNLIYKTWNKDKFSSYASFFDLPSNLMIKNFSKGMKMKLSLAVALSHDSKILILDEFTTGMDSISRAEIIKILKEFINNGNSILFSSHISEDIELLANKFIFMKNGKVVLDIDKNELISNFALLHFKKNSLNSKKENLIAYKMNEHNNSGVALIRKKESSTTDVEPINNIDIITNILIEGVII
ncbi:ABC transporter ATP-binding protein [Staphylococcus pseudintermedius]|uniref:ABC transporter ATP-binding protein n=1 Tax=Staphylococcus pseudintermedius TaxID=283734 RepID=UPI0035C22088